MASLANAIANAEGYGQPNAIPTLANNPGDLVLGDMGYGTLGQRITVFPTSQAGYAALNNQIGLMQSGQSSVYSPNETIAQVGQSWANGDTNWANNVSQSLGVSPNTPLSSLPSSSGGTGISSTPTIFSGLASGLGNIMAGGAASAILGPTGASALSTLLPSTSAASSWNAERIVAILLGMIFIAAGAFSLKTGRDITINTLRAAKSATKTAAEVTA